MNISFLWVGIGSTTCLIYSCFLMSLGHVSLAVILYIFFIYKKGYFLALLFFNAGKCLHADHPYAAYRHALHTNGNVGLIGQKKVRYYPLKSSENLSTKIETPFTTPTLTCRWMLKLNVFFILTENYTNWK